MNCMALTIERSRSKKPASDLNYFRHFFLQSSVDFFFFFGSEKVAFRQTSTQILTCFNFSFKLHKKKFCFLFVFTFLLHSFFLSSILFLFHILFATFDRMLSFSAFNIYFSSSVYRSNVL